MDRLRPAMLIVALVVDVGRRLLRRCGSAVPPSARLVPARVDVSRCVLVMRLHLPPSFWCLRKDLGKFERLTS